MAQAMTLCGFLLGLGTPRSFPHARKTLARASVNPIVRVPFRARGLSGVDGTKAFAAQEIGPGWNGFQVSGVATESGPAKVVKFKVERNRSNAGLVHHAMDKRLATTKADLSVAVGVDGASPKPARFSETEPVNDALKGGRISMHRELILRGVWGRTLARRGLSYCTTGAAR